MRKDDETARVGWNPKKRRKALKPDLHFNGFIELPFACIIAGSA